MNNKLFASMAAGLLMCLSTPLASAEPDSGTAPPPDPSAATQGASPAGTDSTIGRPSSDSTADSSSGDTSQAPTSKVGSEPTDGVGSSGGAQTSAVLRAEEDALSSDTTKLADVTLQIAEADQQVKDRLAEIQAPQEEGMISVQQMFEMQMLMNKLSQLSEMSTAVVSASNTALQSMARNVKG